MTHLMRFIRSTYPLSIVDFGRSISVAALDSLSELETLYLVTTTDLTALDHAQSSHSDRGRTRIRGEPHQGAAEPCAGSRKARSQRH